MAEALRLAAHGESFLTPRVATRLVRSVARPADVKTGVSILEQLTRRETQVLAMIARGAANKDVARSLQLAEGTVKNHITAIFAKLKVSDRLQAALLAREYGLAE